MIKRIYQEENKEMIKFLIETYVGYLKKTTHGKKAYEYSYKLRNNFDSSYYQDIIISEIDKLYNRISFPVDNVDEDRYHTCYNIMYVLYHSDAEKFLQYCEKIKEDCDHMSRHRIEVLVEEIVKNRNKIYIARWFQLKESPGYFHAWILSPIISI